VVALGSAGSAGTQVLYLVNEGDWPSGGGSALERRGEAGAALVSSAWRTLAWHGGCSRWHGTLTISALAEEGGGVTAGTLGS
jgi:hypothetical protein